MHKNTPEISVNRPTPPTEIPKPLPNPKTSETFFLATLLWVCGLAGMLVGRNVSVYVGGWVWLDRWMDGWMDGWMDDYDDNDDATYNTADFADGAAAAVY